MKKRYDEVSMRSGYGIAALLAMLLLGATWLALTCPWKDKAFLNFEEEITTTHLTNDGTTWHFNLVDPEMAPQDIKPLVMRGFNLMIKTHALIPEYAGDYMSCSNCHFSAGNTLGGTNGGISLVGVSKKYPLKIDNGKEMSLADRINGCFERSMNGKALPKDSPHMEAFLAYLNWISSPVKDLPSLPWLGLAPLRTRYSPNLDLGKKVYAKNCAMCHGRDGEGKMEGEDLNNPPLWGAHSFNHAAGMNKLTTISSFIFNNMPYGDPGLTIEEALDVAAYVLTQERPQEKTE